jgi:hypothetical protein
MDFGSEIRKEPETGSATLDPGVNMYSYYEKILIIYFKIVLLFDFFDFFRP